MCMTLCYSVHVVTKISTYVEATPCLLLTRLDFNDDKCMYRKKQTTLTKLYEIHN